MWTPLISICFAWALPASVDARTEPDSVFAWVLGDARIESSRIAPLVVIEDLDAVSIAGRLASMPEGRRGLASFQLLRTISEDPGDHVVVAGRITDHPGPWFDRGAAQAARTLESLADELDRAGTSIDLLLVGGLNPISAERLDTSDDLPWIALRNDARFEKVRSSELTLDGAMSPSNPQWAAWNRFADAAVAGAVDRAVAGLRKTSAASSMVVVCPPAGEGASGSSWTLPFGVRDASAAPARSAFDELLDQVRVAVERRARGISVVPRLLPRSHPGTSESRSFVAATSLWNESARHALLIGAGRVLYIEDRAAIDAEDGHHLVAVLDEAASEAWSSSLHDSPTGIWSFRQGDGYFASGFGTPDGDTVWRISFAPGFTEVRVVLDGTPKVVRRQRDQSGAWLVHSSAADPKFFEVAERRGAEFPQTARTGMTGGGLVAADGIKVSSTATIDRADSILVPRTPEIPGIELPGDGSMGFTDQDFNGDGVVDGADQAIWLSGGASSIWTDVETDTPHPGDLEPGSLDVGQDLNGDGVVDGEDLAIRLAGAGSLQPSPTRSERPASRDRIDLRVKDPIGTFTNSRTDEGAQGWGGTGIGDLDGNGAVDGADLAIHLASRGDLASGDDQAELDATGGISETGADPTGPGLPPQVDPTIPIGSAGDAETTPPSQPSAVKVLFDGLPIEAIAASLQADGVERYIIVYEGVDPNARLTGQIDADRVVQHIRDKHGDSPTGFGILDFENPFFERMTAGPEGPHYQMTVATIVALLDRVRQEFPNVKWTMYGMPKIKYWGPVGSYGWATATEASREELLSRALEAFRPVLERCDWLNPSVYDRYELARQNESSWPMWNDRERSWREYTVLLCQRFNESHDGPRKPIIPMVSPLFFKVGQIEYNMKYMTAEELLRDQVRPVMDAGADGIAFWTGLSYWTHAATAADDLGWFQQESRVALGNDFFETPPSDWVDDSLRADLRQRVSERVSESIQLGLAEARSILATRMAGVSEP